MSSMRTYLISFDVADDHRRARLSKLLESRGQRVQWSVFEILGTAATIRSLLDLATAAGRFDAAEDSLRCYPLCAECQGKVLVFGTGPPPAAPGSPLVL